MAEALGVVEDGRERLGRPRFFAFEAGVLREEVRDVDGAVREYLAALWPEASRLLLLRSSGTSARCGAWRSSSAASACGRS